MVGWIVEEMGGRRNRGMDGLIEGRKDGNGISRWFDERWVSYGRKEGRRRM